MQILTLLQFFVRTQDADVESYLKMFTLLPLEMIDGIVYQHKVGPVLSIVDLRMKIFISKHLRNERHNTFLLMRSLSWFTEVSRICER